MSLPLEKQLEELQLINCSLLPGEVLTFLDYCKIWDELLHEYSSGTLSINKTEHGIAEIPQATFQVSLETWNVWFEITFPHAYAGSNSGDNTGSGEPQVSVKGEDTTRTEQEEWLEVVREKLAEIGETEYPIYQLLFLHLLPLLHEKADSASTLASTEPLSNFQAQGQTDRLHRRHISQIYHALFVSHHLVSPKKRRSLQGWSSSLRISGFAKLGYPGVIYAQGSKEDVEEFVENVKGMQWLALRLRFLEVLPDEMKAGSREDEAGLEGWKELQKVGEVMEEMRRIGREKYVVEMGIGSAGTGTSS